MKHVVLAVALSAIAVAAAAQVSTLTIDTGAQELLIGRARPGDLVGEGLDFGTLAQAASSTPLRWSKHREETDRYGNRHVFYRQQLALPSGRLVPLHGGEVGVHWRPDGTLLSIGGAQFTEVTPLNRDSIASYDVLRRARQALAARGGRPVTLPEFEGERIASSELKLVSGGDGRHFRYVWRVPVDAEGGDVFDVYIDAESGDLLSAASTSERGNCGPSTSTSSSATGTPIRSGLSPRALKRSGLVTPRDGAMYEAYFWGTGGGSRNISVFQDTSTTNTTFSCNASSAKYSLIPLTQYYNTINWKGSYAGDAMYFADMTMRTINEMGRSGWDGSNTEAKMVISLSSSWSDNASFSTTASPERPANSVLIGPGSLTYTCAASLDCVAHEWGHGIIRTSAGYSSSQGTGALAEGWADVIGNMVEKKRLPPGTGLEQSSDWHMFEDDDLNGEVARSADFDDGTSGHSYNGTVNHKLHKDDQPDVGEQPHERGNQLSVAYKVLSLGGTNPACARLPLLTGCSSSVVGLGFNKASEIMFHTLVYYLTSSISWEGFADYAAQMAFDAYNNCTVDPLADARAEQSTIGGAFRAIGYPRQNILIRCP